MTVEHLVDVPIEWDECGRQRQLAEILRQLQQDRERSPHRAAEEKWAEPVGEQGWLSVHEGRPALFATAE